MFFSAAMVVVVTAVTILMYASALLRLSHFAGDCYNSLYSFPYHSSLMEVGIPAAVDGKGWLDEY